MKAGDRILFGKYSGTEIKVDDTRLPDPARRRSAGSHRRRESGRRQEVSLTGALDAADCSGKCGARRGGKFELINSAIPMD